MQPPRHAGAVKEITPFSPISAHCKLQFVLVHQENISLLLLPKCGTSSYYLLEYIKGAGFFPDYYYYVINEFEK